MTNTPLPNTRNGIRAQTPEPPIVVPLEPAQKKKMVKRKKAKQQQKETFFEKFLKLSMRIVGKPAKSLANRFPSLRDDVLRSNIYVSVEGIFAISIFLSLLMIPVAAALIYVLIIAHFALGILFVPLVAVIPLAIGLSVVKISESSRASALDNELPYLVGYITVLAGGGISPMVTIKRVSKADAIFPAAAREARRILLDIEVFGLDAISALERITKYTPNRMFSDFLGGYVAVLKTGGDAVSYLESKLKEIFAYRESKVRASSDFIGNLAESYIIATVVMGVGLMILFATQNLLSTNASQVTNIDPTMIILFSGLFVPVISLVFIVVIGSAQIKEPFSYDLQYYVFMAGLPIAAVLFFVPMGLPLYMQLGLGLIIATLPAMVINLNYARHRKAVEAKLSNFLRDISEVRKTGLAPEKTIEQLAYRDYGGLSPHIKQISSQLSWGTPIRTVLENFSASVKSWITRAMAFLLLEVVDVGGGSPKMFISLADFMEKNSQLEKERRSMVRTFVIVPYIGAIMVVITTAMMIYFVSAPQLAVQGIQAYLPSQHVIDQARTVLLTASFFQAWVMGLVAGKMGEASVGDGFKHATALVVISMITVLASNLLFGGLA